MSPQDLARMLFPNLAALKDAGLCINCERPQPPEAQARWSPAGRAEFAISGMCEPCFDTRYADDPYEEEE